jgi:hypothetical protein
VESKPPFFKIYSADRSKRVRPRVVDYFPAMRGLRMLNTLPSNNRVFMLPLKLAEADKPESVLKTVARWRFITCLENKE